MYGVKLLIIIVPRGKGDAAASLCRENGLTFSMISPAHGAAGTHFMDYLGLTDPEKDVVFSVAQAGFAQEMLGLLHRRFQMNEPDTGIAASIPIAGVSGPRALRYISGGFPSPSASLGPQPPKAHIPDKMQPSNERSATNMNQISPAVREFDLIITIVNRGFSDPAIEASKKAGARGGTVLYARGTGVHEVETFFSISIQPEKEVILSLVRHETTKDVMHAIIEAAGLQTEGRGLCFSLPVDEVTGIAGLRKEPARPNDSEASEQTNIK